MGDSEARFRRPHGTAVCGERRKRGPDLACVPSVIHVDASAEQLRAAVQRRQGPGSSDGRFVTLRVCHRMAVGIRRMRGRLSAAKPCACSAAKCVWLRRLGRFVRSAFSRILCIVHLYAVKTTERVLLVHYCTQSKTLVRSQNNTCTQSKQQDVPLCTSSAVGLLKSVQAGQSRQRPFAQERRGDARHLEGCEADERPCQDRDLDPP